MTSEERSDLLKLYLDAAHQHIVFSHLVPLIENSEWDSITERAGQKAMELVERILDEEFERREREAAA